MVHALEEATRVLKPGGLLVDLRPAVVHRKVGILHGGRLQSIGHLQEDFSLDRAADAAWKRFTRPETFRVVQRRSFPCNRYLDSLAAFREFLDEFIEEGQSRVAARKLLNRVGRAWSEAAGPKRIVITAPLRLTAMQRRR